MKQQFAPVGAKIRDEKLRESRQRLYNPGQLQRLGGALLDLMSEIDDFAHSVCRPCKCVCMPGSTYVEFDGTFSEPRKKGIAVPLHADVQIDQITYHAPASRRRRLYDVRIYHYDDEDNDFAVSSYQLRESAKGVIGMFVCDSTDGLAEALRHDDELFLRAVTWKRANEYNAVTLYEELQDFRKLSAGISGGNKMI